MVREPTALELIAVLKHHPEVYAEVVREGALLLLDPWVVTAYRSPDPGTLPEPVEGAEGRPVPETGQPCGYGRHLALHPNSSNSLAGEVRFDFVSRHWETRALVAPHTVLRHETLDEAKEQADSQLQHHGYLLLRSSLLPKPRRF